jgi:dTDP-4-dehydrorhamnose reductase
MKILLFGAGGLLGRHLSSHLRLCGHDVTALTRAEADITDGKQIGELFGQPWDAVINAAAVCNFDACENDPAATGRVNRDAPLDLARRCAAHSALFVQFSSDYVFGGKVDRVLTESDKPAPISVYGEQKAALEREIPKLCPRSLVIRLSWLYGAGGKTFMSLLPDLLSQKESLEVASGKKGGCLYAADAALWIERLVSSEHTGLFNLVNAGGTSWEEFARRCAKHMSFAETKIREVPYENIGPDWSKRPRYSCLDTAKLERALPPGPRPWTEALDSFLKEWKSVAANRRV